MNGMNLTRQLMSREGFLAVFTLSFGAIAGLVVGIPILGYVLSPLINQPKEKWQTVKFTSGSDAGKPVAADSLTVGETREVVFLSNSPQPWAGTTARQGAWLRRTGSNTYIAYAIYCTHLGCPIHWLAEAKIFLCPCHGSVFNADGTVAGGPAPRPLFTYNVRVQGGHVEIQTHPLPIIT